MNALSALMVSAAFIAFCTVFLSGVFVLMSSKQTVLEQKAVLARVSWLCVLAESLSKSPDTLLLYAPSKMEANCSIQMRWSDGWVVRVVS